MRRWIASLAAVTAVAVAGLVLAALWIVSAPRPAFSNADASRFEMAGDPALGRLVFAAGDCASCHASPGQSNRLRLGGGMALASPFGVFRVPNISPDPVDGIGRWRTVDLANALIAGVSPAGTHYYPGLPYTSFTHMTVADIRDLMAYLRTLPKVSGRAPPHELFPLFRIRRAIGLWKFLFFQEGPSPPDASHGDEWQRGRYLVETIGHCAECHSSRNLLGAIRPATRFAGGIDPEGVGYIPNITPARIGSWSVDQIVEVLTSGHTPDDRFIGSTMADVVTNTAMLPESDRRAIAIYLKSLPRRPTSQP
jgi:mono/diheme cytochrome c family protein